MPPARRWATSVLLVLVPLLLAFSVNAADPPDDKPCTLHAEGKYYDLNPLKASKDYQWNTEEGHMFVLNVCKPVSHESFGLRVPNPAEVAGFIRKDHGDFSIGETNTTLVMSQGGPKLVLKNGSNCKSANGDKRDDRAGTIIEFVCDTSVFGAGTPRLSAQFPVEDEQACAFFIEWRTHFACPTGERGGPWGFFAILAIIITFLVMAYLVFGTLYNRYVLQLRGFDQIPQFSLEAMKYHGREALEWFRDMMAHLYEGGQRGGWGGGVPRSWGGSNANRGSGFGVGSQLGAGGGGFRRPMPRGAPPATNPVSHQAQVDVGGNGDSTSALDESGQGVGGFVRPSRGGSGTNPVSHQSQVNAASGQQQQQQQRAPAPAPTPVHPQKRYESGSSTREERTFMLGDDDDEEEDVAATPTVANTAGAAALARPAETPANSDPSAETEPSAAQLRGRDMGDQGTIRL